jgi:hypothetical protein
VLLELSTNRAGLHSQFRFSQFASNPSSRPEKLDSRSFALSTLLFEMTADYMRRKEDAVFEDAFAAL